MFLPFHDPRSHRLLLADLAKPEAQERLRLIWQDPDNLNPGCISAEVTREVAAVLARRAKSLEEGWVKSDPNKPLALIHKAQTAPETIANYPTRCLFCMFAEDIELLPKGAFQNLLLTPEQIDLLIAAARANWREVEPAIFGTLLERALKPTDRHALGAHYTPRAYVERLVLPTVIEPLHRLDLCNKTERYQLFF